jgi:hypothetical protein
MTPPPMLRTFEEFWPYYVGEHRQASTRALHVAGTHLALAAALLGVLHSPWWLLAAPGLGYSLAWFGHFFFEHNTPATFKHPLWSVRGDFRMLRLTWAGKMAAEVDRVTRIRGDDNSRTETVKS